VTTWAGPELDPITPTLPESGIPRSGSITTGRGTTIPGSGGSSQRIRSSLPEGPTSEKEGRAITRLAGLAQLEQGTCRAAVVD
jgi:hypothetical protein